MREAQIQSGNEGWPLAANLRQFESAKPLQKAVRPIGRTVFLFTLEFGTECIDF